MAGASPAFPPRPDVAPRPDVVTPVVAYPPRRRGRGAVAFLLLLSLLAGAVGAAVVGTRDALRPTAATGDGAPSHVFLQATAQGPFRWDPCTPIHYEWNATEAPPGAVEDLREVVRRLAEDTGIEFVDEGPTERTDRDQRAQRFVRPGSLFDPLPVLVTWVRPADFRRYADPELYAGVGMAVPLSDDYGRYRSGLIVMNADRWLRPGFADRFAHGVILQHEWGHVLGLGHVGSPEELMWSSEVEGAAATPDLGLTDWGPGDLEGLAELGREAGCLN